MKWALAALVVVGCDRRAAVTSCDDDLHGTWTTDTGARWALLDRGKTLEAFPVFDDGAGSGAPRVIDLERKDKLAGDVKRRFMQGATECVAKAPIRIAKCKDNTLQVVVADPLPPLAFSPCSWGTPAPARVEHWRRD
jgi:hypothetical protein